MSAVTEGRCEGVGLIYVGVQSVTQGAGGEGSLRDGVRELD